MITTYAEQTQSDVRMEASITVNGSLRTLRVEPRTGACTVHIEGRRILSCMTLAAMHDGQRITTIEGLESNGSLHPLQEMFIEHDGFQCGFCTSGQIMSAVAMIEEAKAGWPSAATTDVTKPFTMNDLSKAEIRERMSGNLCRCSCYPNIVAAVAQVAGRR